MTAARTFAIIAACVAVLALAAQFSRRGPAAAQSSVPTQAELDATLNPGPLTKARAINAPAQPSPSAQLKAHDDLVASTRELEQKYLDLDVFRSIRGKSNVMVGAAFFQVDFGVKSQACAAVSNARSVLGLSRAYALREPMNGRAIGYYNGQRLSMD